MLITPSKWVEYLINKRGVEKKLIPWDSFPGHFNYNLPTTVVGTCTYLQDSQPRRSRHLNCVPLSHLERRLTPGQGGKVHEKRADELKFSGFIGGGGGAEECHRVAS